jgi:DNA gyrase/topoisomerase IV subunit A
MVSPASRWGCPPTSRDNLGEVLDALINAQTVEKLDDLDVVELMQFIQGPDSLPAAWSTGATRGMARIYC